MLLETLAGAWRKARSVNYATNGFRTLVPIATDPRGQGTTDTGASAIDPFAGQPGGPGQNSVFVKPYALGADDVTFSTRVWIWTPTSPFDTTLLNDPTMLCEIACIASTVTGKAGGLVLNTERFADTLTVTTGNSGLSLEVLSNTSNLAGWFRVDISGPFYLDLDFTTGGSATSCNALWRTF